MERICTIATVAAVTLTVGAALLDVAAIADRQQNQIDTAAIIVSTVCAALWLFCGIVWAQDRKLRALDARIDDAQARTRAEASRARRRLAFDPPTLPLTVPATLRRVK